MTTATPLAAMSLAEPRNNASVTRAESETAAVDVVDEGRSVRPVQGGSSGRLMKVAVGARDDLLGVDRQPERRRGFFAVTTVEKGPRVNWLIWSVRAGLGQQRLATVDVSFRPGG